MNTNIHPTAIISPDANIADGVRIGPFSIIGGARIGANSVIHSHVVVSDGVEIGEEVEVFPGALIGKEPKGAGATARTPSFERVVSIANGCSIGPNVVVYYDVKIGANTLLGDGASIREGCSIGSKCILSRYVTVNYATTIGDRTKVMDNTHLTGNMHIGDDVFISTMVGTANDNLIRAGYGSHITGPKINDFAFVGAGATLLPNTEIGAHAVVGSGAVVTKSVEAYTVVAGVPARFVRVVDR